MSCPAAPSPALPAASGRIQGESGVEARTQEIHRHIGSLEGVYLESTAYEGEVRTDLDVFSEDDIILDADVLVDPRPTRVAWRVSAESEPEAKAIFKVLELDPILSNFGMVQISNADWAQYRKSYRNFPDLASLSKQALIYRPKDDARFNQLLEKVRFIGDRQRGRLLGMVSQLFVAVEPRAFVFVQGVAKFSVRFSTVLYAGYGRPGERPEAGPVDEFSRSTKPLIREVREKFLERAGVIRKARAASGEAVPSFQEGKP